MIRYSIYTDKIKDLLRKKEFTENLFEYEILSQRRNRVQCLKVRVLV